MYANRGALLRVTGRALCATFVTGSLVFSALTHADGEHGDAPPTMPDPKTTYSPYLQDTFPNQVFFGDTHLHTAYSADAGFFLTDSRPMTRFDGRGERRLPRLPVSPPRLFGPSISWW